MSQQQKPFSHRGQAVTVKERDVVRGNNKWKGSVAGLGGVSGPVDFLPVKLVHTMGFFGTSVMFQNVP